MSWRSKSDDLRTTVGTSKASLRTDEESANKSLEFRARETIALSRILKNLEVNPGHGHTEDYEYHD